MITLKKLKLLAKKSLKSKGGTAGAEGSRAAAERAERQQGDNTDYAQYIKALQIAEKNETNKHENEGKYECCICFEFKVEKELFTETECYNLHKFCKECASDWFINGQGSLVEDNTNKKLKGIKCILHDICNKFWIIWYDYPKALNGVIIVPKSNTFSSLVNYQPRQKQLNEELAKIENEEERNQRIPQKKREACTVVYEESTLTEEQKKDLVKVANLNSWIANFCGSKVDTRPCPYCKIPIIRSEGCNVMQCARCTKCFCFSCLTIHKCNLMIKQENESRYMGHSFGICQAFDSNGNELPSELCRPGHGNLRSNLVNIFFGKTPTEEQKNLITDRIIDCLRNKEKRDYSNNGDLTVWTPGIAVFNIRGYRINNIQQNATPAAAQGQVGQNARPAAQDPGRIPVWHRELQDYKEEERRYLEAQGYYGLPGLARERDRLREKAAEEREAERKQRIIDRTLAEAMPGRPGTAARIYGQQPRPPPIAPPATRARRPGTAARIYGQPQPPPIAPPATRARRPGTAAEARAAMILPGGLTPEEIQEALKAEEIIAAEQAAAVAQQNQPQQPHPPQRPRTGNERPANQRVVAEKIRAEAEQAEAEQAIASWDEVRARARIAGDEATRAAATADKHAKAAAHFMAVLGITDTAGTAVTWSREEGRALQKIAAAKKAAARELQERTAALAPVAARALQEKAAAAETAAAQAREVGWATRASAATAEARALQRRAAVAEQAAARAVQERAAAEQAEARAVQERAATAAAARAVQERAAAAAEARIRDGIEKEKTAAQASLIAQRVPIEEARRKDKTATINTKRRANAIINTSETDPKRIKELKKSLADDITAQGKKTEHDYIKSLINRDIKYDAQFQEKNNNEIAVILCMHAAIISSELFDKRIQSRISNRKAGDALKAIFEKKKAGTDINQAEIAKTRNLILTAKHIRDESIEEQTLQYNIEYNVITILDYIIKNISKNSKWPKLKEIWDKIFEVTQKIQKTIISTAGFELRIWEFGESTIYNNESEEFKEQFDDAKQAYKKLNSDKQYIGSGWNNNIIEPTPEEIAMKKAEIKAAVERAIKIAAQIDVNDTRDPENAIIAFHDLTQKIVDFWKIAYPATRDLVAEIVAAMDAYNNSFPQQETREPAAANRGGARSKRKREKNNTKDM